MAKTSLITPIPQPAIAFIWGVESWGELVHLERDFVIVCVGAGAKLSDAQKAKMLTGKTWNVQIGSNRYQSVSTGTNCANCYQFVPVAWNSVARCTDWYHWYVRVPYLKER